ncbi:MAG TPA: hypothetical protein VEQ60_09400 [Longimicrobium sp.]|nr:hypothetical protein [Longimicrobium sp.]
MTPNSSNPLDLIWGYLIAAMGLGIFYLGMSAVVAPASEVGSWRPAFGLLAAGGAGVMAYGARMSLRWLRAARMPKPPRHQDLMRAAVGLPPAPALRPPPLPGYAPAPAAPIAAADAAPVAKPASPATPAAPIPVADAAPVAKPTSPATPAAPTVAADAPAPAAPGSPAAVGERTLPSGEPILAHWTYPAEEWRAYTEGEWRYRLWEAVGLALLIGLVGGLIATWRTGESSYGSALLFGGFLGLLRLGMASSQRIANTAGPGYAIISPTAVLLNGTHHPLVSERRHFGGVRYASLDRPPVLEFTVKWKTRNGWMNEQIRVPIPAGREDEANAVVAAFERGWAVELAPEDGSGALKVEAEGPPDPSRGG